MTPAVEYVPRGLLFALLCLPIGMVSDNVFNVDLLKSYGKDLLMFVGFAALGVFGTVRRLVGDRQG